MFNYKDLDEALSELLQQKKKSKKELPIGVDGLSQDKFLESRHFHLKEILRGLEKTFLSGSQYRFGTLYQLSRTKKAGGVRYLYVPRIRDQIVFKAMLNVLRQHLKVASVSPRRIVIDFHSHARQYDEPWILRTDISDYYNSIDRNQLIFELKKVRGIKPELLTLMEHWFSNIAYRCSVSGKRHFLMTGLPQGVSLSSILAEFYLTSIDDQIGTGYFRYVDDIIFVAENRGEALSAFEKLRGLLLEKKLQLARSKTKIAPLSSGIDWVGLNHFPDKIVVAEHKYAEWRKGMIRAFREVRNDHPRSGYDESNSHTIKEIIFTKARDYIFGENNRRIYWFQLIKDTGQWNELDRFIHGQIKFTLKYYGLRIEEEDKLPSIKLHLSRVKRMKPPIAD